MTPHGAENGASSSQRLLDDAEHQGAERGWLLMPVGVQTIDGDPASAHDTFAEAATIGERFGDPDLVACGRMGQGRARIRLGHSAAGVELLDEVMVAVTAGEVSPIYAGLLYCSLIEACQEIFDLRRAREWTTALTRWCESQPDLVPYRGRCLVYRAEIMQLHGDWTDALEEAQRAGERLSSHPGDRLARSRRDPHLSTGSLDDRGSDLRQFMQWCHDIDLAPLAATRTHIELYRGWMEERSLAASTVDRRLTTVCGYYRFAHIDGRISANPAQYVRRPRASRSAASTADRAPVLA